MEKNVNNNSGEKKKGGIRAYIPLFVAIAIVVIAVSVWYKNYAKYIATDDAYIDTDNITVSSKILGRIVHVYANEGDTVVKGQLLAKLDTSDILAQKDHALAAKKQAESSVTQAEAQYNYNQESIKVLEVNLDKAKTDLDRATEQFKGGVIPQEQFDHTKKAWEIANAQLEAAKTQLNVAKAQIESARAAVGSANAQIEVINTQLNNTDLYAPVTGIVAKKWLLSGDIVQPGQSVYTVTNNHKLWVLVYLEETKIANVHLDQKTIFTVDAFPGVKFTGKVFAIGSNTASQFSLIPPNNASGNFTKVTQRIPVKISIDGTQDNEKLSAYNLLAGMSVVAKIVKD